MLLSSVMAAYAAISKDDKKFLSFYAEDLRVLRLLGCYDIKMELY